MKSRLLHNPNKQPNLEQDPFWQQSILLTSLEQCEITASRALSLLDKFSIQFVERVLSGSSIYNRSTSRMDMVTSFGKEETPFRGELLRILKRILQRDETISEATETREYLLRCITSRPSIVLPKLNCRQVRCGANRLYAAFSGNSLRLATALTEESV